MHKLLVYLLAAANFGVIMWFWLRGSGALLTAGGYDTTLALGRLAGLLAAHSVLWQFLMMGRPRWLESAFGLDRISRLHRLNGLAIFWLVLLHPVLIVLAYARGSSLIGQYFSLIGFLPSVFAAAVASFLLYLVIASSIVIVRRRLRYETWYFVHLAVYAAVALAFMHQIELGGDMLASPLFRAYWIGFYIFVFANLLVFRIARPVWLYQRHRFRVDRVVAETGTVTSVYIKGRRIDRFKFQGGQFAFWRFLAPGLGYQAHPFSLSQPPDGRELRISVRALGDFTRAVPQIKPGTPVVIDGPYGIFTASRSRRPKVLLIAGGIGITPIRSMLDDLAAAKRDVVLLYGNQTSADIPLRDEVDKLARRPNVDVHHVLSNQPGFKGETGLIDIARIKRLVPDFGQRDIYLCGPPPMMRGLIASLTAAGVGRQHIYYEKFSLA